MEISKNSRQMPKVPGIVKQKNYCDLLYAWLQCHSERASVYGDGRRIYKQDVKWVKIERDFTRQNIEGENVKVMTRKTIKKYFDYLLEIGLVEEGPDEYYYLTTLEKDEANLIDYTTLAKLMNVLQKRSISIYIYLFNRYYASGFEPFIATSKQIKEYIGIASSTTSNNLLVTDTLEILEKLGLLKTEIIHKDEKTYIQFLWVKNKLE